MYFQRLVGRGGTVPDITLLGLRETRLKSECAHLYPGIEPGVWKVAASVLPLALRRRVAAEGSWEFARRILDDTHFEFRGGRSRNAGWTGLLTRVEDP